VRHAAAEADAGGGEGEGNNNDIISLETRPLKMAQHDPREHIRGLYQLLQSDKKRIGFLFGAGTSLGTGVQEVSIPAVAQMTTSVVNTLSATDAWKVALEQIKEEIDDTRYSVESLLTTIETKREVVGSGQLNGLDNAGLTELAKELKREIGKLASVHDRMNPEQAKSICHMEFAQWVRNARRRFPIEIFTTNYDYLFEMAMEASNLPYFDGFSGSYEPFFCAEDVEDMQAYPGLVKLWKLHGSLGWFLRERDGVISRDRNADVGDMLIYPSHLKYRASKKQPYIGLIDRLCEFVQQDDTILITCGYSFGDEHINERLMTSLRRGANSHVLAFYFDEWKDAEGQYQYGLADKNNALAQLATNGSQGKLSVLGFRHAVIGGKHGVWSLSAAPNPSESIAIDLYYDQDAAMPSEEEGEHKGGEVWTGQGRFHLPRFTSMVAFLSDMAPPSTNGTTE